MASPDPLAMAALRRAARGWRVHAWLRCAVHAGSSAALLSAAAWVIAGCVLATSAVIACSALTALATLLRWLPEAWRWRDAGLCLEGIDRAMAAAAPAWQHAPLASAWRLAAQPPAHAAPWMIARTIALGAHHAAHIDWRRIAPLRMRPWTALRACGAVAVWAMLGAVWWNEHASARAVTATPALDPVIAQVRWLVTPPVAKQPELVSEQSRTFAWYGSRVRLELRIDPEVAAIEAHGDDASRHILQREDGRWILHTTATTMRELRLHVATPQGRHAIIAQTLHIDVQAVVPPEVELRADGESGELRVQCRDDLGLESAIITASADDGARWTWTMPVRDGAFRRSARAAVDWRVVGPALTCFAVVKGRSGLTATSAALRVEAPDPDAGSALIADHAQRSIDQAVQQAEAFATSLRAYRQLLVTDPLSASAAARPLRAHWAGIRRDVQRVERLLQSVSATVASACAQWNAAHGAALARAFPVRSEAREEVDALHSVRSAVADLYSAIARARALSNAQANARRLRENLLLQRSAEAWAGRAWSPGLHISAVSASGSAFEPARMPLLLDVKWPRDMRGEAIVSAHGWWWSEQSTARAFEVRGKADEVSVRIAQQPVAVQRGADGVLRGSSATNTPAGWVELACQWRQAAHTRVTWMRVDADAGADEWSLAELRHRATLADGELLQAMVFPALTTPVGEPLTLTASTTARRALEQLRRFADEHAERVRTPSVAAPPELVASALEELSHHVARSARHVSWERVPAHAIALWPKLGAPRGAAPWEADVLLPAPDADPSVVAHRLAALRLRAVASPDALMARARSAIQQQRADANAWSDALAAAEIAVLRQADERMRRAWSVAVRSAASTASAASAAIGSDDFDSDMSEDPERPAIEPRTVPSAIGDGPLPAMDLTPFSEDERALIRAYQRRALTRER